VTGCGGAESAQHLFLSCGTFTSLWPLVQAWIGFSTADTHNLSNLLYSSLNQLVLFVLGGLFCNFFGLLVSGLCGMKETIEYSEIQRTLFISFWTKSRRFLIGG
jgi:ABC-type anion transport system duplicated permease subunit